MDQHTPRRFWTGFVSLPVIGIVALAAGLAVGSHDTPATVDAAAQRWDAVADTYVIAERPAAAPGTQTKLTATRWPEWHTKTYVRFDVDGLRTDVPLASVTVAFTVQRIQGHAQRVELREVPSATWSESQTSYQDRPATGDMVAVAAASAGTTTLRFDVTRHVRAAGSYSFALVNRTADTALVVNSREYGSGAPRLLVGYGAPTSPSPSPSRTTDPSPTGSPAPTGSQSPSPSPTGTPPAPFHCGAAFKPEAEGETYQEALGREDRLLGGLDIARVYYTGAPAPWPGKLDTSGRPAIVSFKLPPRDILAGSYDARLREWFAAAPTTRDTYWVYFHEPEDNIARGEFSAADYRAAWRHLAVLAGAAGNPRLHATLVLMGYSVEPPSGRDWRDYYAGRDVVDVLAWDIYNYVNEGAGGYRDPATLFGRAAEVTAAEGLPFAVAEVGSAIAEGDDGTGRAAWLRSTLRYLRDRQAVFVSYFDMYVDHNHGPQHYELRDLAAQTAYREICG
ncbi:MAG: DUF7594 domain-containing protein [Micromonosporaceae bacterium]